LGLEVRREFWAIVAAVGFGEDAEITWMHSISDCSEGRDRLLELREDVVWIEGSDLKYLRFS